MPFIVAHPDGRAAGEVSSHFASTHDVGPTLLSLAGHRPPALDGGPRPLPADGRRAAVGPRPFHYGGMFNRFYIRTDEWLLIGDNRGEERTMYDLQRDPHEFFDVVKENPKLSEELYQQVLEAAGGPLPYYEGRPTTPGGG